MSEKMKDIPGYEGLYAITEDGRVWSYPKNIQGGHAGIFLKPGIAGGYLFVVLTKNLKRKHFSVHRINAMTHIQNPNNYPIVLHLDNNKLNNHYLNLKWGTHSQNIRQAHNDGLIPITERRRETSKKNGMLCGKKIMQLTKEGILCKIYDSAHEVKRITGIDQGAVCRCAIGRKGYITAGGYIWKFLI